MCIWCLVGSYIWLLGGSSSAAVSDYTPSDVTFVESDSHIKHVDKHDKLIIMFVNIILFYHVHDHIVFIGPPPMLCLHRNSAARWCHHVVLTSSRIKIGEFFNRARAIATLWRRHNQKHLPPHYLPSMLTIEWSHIPVSLSTQSRRDDKNTLKKSWWKFYMHPERPYLLEIGDTWKNPNTVISSAISPEHLRI